MYLLKHNRFFFVIESLLCVYFSIPTIYIPNIKPLALEKKEILLQIYISYFYIVIILYFIHKIYILCVYFIE